VGDLLEAALLVDLQLFPPQVLYGAALAVDGRRGEHDQVAARPEGREAAPALGGRSTRENDRSNDRGRKEHDVTSEGQTHHIHHEPKTREIPGV
jgi:hypothetical protein